MLRLFFISAATHFNTARELNEIMRVARMRNRAEGVSSLLIYNDGSFAQLMEGPKQAILNVFERIKADTRHNGVAVIFQEEADTRITKGWDMQLLPASKIAADDDYDFMTLPDFHASPQYEALMRHPALRGFLAGFKAVAKKPVAPKPGAEGAPAIASEPAISNAAARFLKLYGTSRRFADHLPIPGAFTPANDSRRNGRSGPETNCGGL